MITQHIGNETTIYTLSSGTEIVLKDYELKELMESNDVTKELLRQMNELKYDAQDYAKKCSNLRDTVHDLEIKISNLEKEKKEEACNWHQEDYESSYWSSDCGIQFVLDDGTPKENNMNYCCKCGKKLVEQMWNERNDNE